MPHTINPTILETLKNLISTKTGLVEFGGDDQKLIKLFGSRIKELKLHSADEYIKLLSDFGEGGNEELKKIALELSNTETFFFRDHGQMVLLREKILPRLIEKNSISKTLRIWSAACSSGEEIYSVSMILHQLIPNINDWNIELTGTDINLQALEKARKGLYTSWSFRMVPEHLIREYFTLVKNVYHLKEKIKNLATFKYFNLVADLSDFPGTTKDRFDLIICRNVFIYFNSAGIEKAVTNFVKALKSEGYLLTGHSELANRHFPGLTLVPYPQSFIFQKSDKTKYDTTTRFQDFKFAEPKNEEKNEWRAPGKKKAVKIELPFQETREVESPSDESALLDLARTKANSGKLDEAKVLCDKINEGNPFNPGSYFLLGQIANESGEIQNAIALFNKVLYLDHEFFPASLELAAIHDFFGERQKANRCRTTVLEQLKRSDPDKTVIFYQNMKISEIIDEINKMITL